MAAAFSLFLLAGGLVFLRAKARANWANAEAKIRAELERLVNEQMQQRLK
jgi:hypothetical protein